MLVQAFWRDALLLDESALDASGQPLMQRLESGVDYLRTFGPPRVALGSQRERLGPKERRRCSMHQVRARRLRTWGVISP